MSAVNSMYSIGRARWYDPFRKVWRYVASRKAEERIFSEIRPGQDILEIGCGTGMIPGLLQGRWKTYTGVDQNKDMLAIAKKKRYPRTKYLKKDLYTFVPDKKYDVIMSVWVFSHLKGQAKLVARYRKYLKKGGKMLLLFQTKPRWYINMWFYLFSRMFFTRYVPEDEIKRFPGVVERRSYYSGLTTVVIIKA